VTVQLDRPGDLVPRHVGVGPDRNEPTPLTRRERRARERAAVQRYQARRLPPPDYPATMEPPTASLPVEPPAPLPVEPPAPLPVEPPAPPVPPPVPPAGTFRATPLAAGSRDEPPAPPCETEPPAGLRAEPPLPPLDEPPPPSFDEPPFPSFDEPPFPSFDEPPPPPLDEPPFPSFDEPDLAPEPDVEATPLVTCPPVSYHPRHHADPYATVPCSTAPPLRGQALDGPNAEPAHAEQHPEPDDLTPGAGPDGEPEGASDGGPGAGLEGEPEGASESVSEVDSGSEVGPGSGTGPEPGPGPHQPQILSASPRLLSASPRPSEQLPGRVPGKASGAAGSGTVGGDEGVARRRPDTAQPGSGGLPAGPRDRTPPDTGVAPPSGELYRPLVTTPVTRAAAKPAPASVPLLRRLPVLAPARPAKQVPDRPSIHAPGRLLPPGRPGAPGPAPAAEPRRAACGADRGRNPDGPRRVRRGVLAGFAVLGVVAGALGGLRLGHEIARARTAEHHARELTTDASAGTGPRTGDTVARSQLGRAAATGTTQVADRAAQGLPRIGAPVSEGISAVAAGGSAVRTASVPGARTSLYVYWVTSSATRSLLAREYRNVPDYGDPLVSAVQAMLRQRPADPDYDSPWRPADTVAVRAGAAGITVTLSADAFAATSISSGVAAAAIQQLVWTVTTAAQRDLPVTVQVADTTAFQAWGAVALGTPVRRDTRFRACVWIDTPQEAGVQHGTVRIAGQGSAFEGTYRWKVVRSGKQVAAGVAIGSPAGPGAKWTQFAVDVPLQAGAYLLTVVPDDPGDQEMPAGWTWPDTRSFTVG
jgi:hypothetical protein